MDYWIINSECLRKSAFYIQKTSFRVCTDGGCVYTREGVIHQSQSEERRYRSGDSTRVRTNEQKGVQERKTTSEWQAT